MGENFFSRIIDKVTGKQANVPPRTQGERTAMTPEAPSYSMAEPPESDDAIRETGETILRAQKAAAAENEERLKSIRENL